MDEKENKKKRLCAYVRVSSTKQKHDESYKTQIKRIKDWGKLRGDDVEIVKWYEDLGKSAFKERPQFNIMMDSLDECDGIIISDLTRIGRGLNSLVNIINTLEKEEKDLIVIDVGVDTTTKEGKLLFHIRAAFAEYHARVIEENTRWGRERAIEEGVKFGRKEKKLKISKARIKKLYEESELGTYMIGKIAGCSSTKIGSILREMGVTLRTLPHQERLLEASRIAKEEIRKKKEEGK